MESRLPDGYALRPGQDEDIDALQKADLSASGLFRPTGLIDEGPNGFEPIPAYELERGIAEGLLFIISDPFDTPVGFALGRIKAPDLYLDQVSVDPAHGKRGLGAALVTRIAEEAEARRLKGVVLSTFRDLAWNGPFYRKLGFSELPRSKMKSWMKDLETIQEKSMDITLRCFMRKPTRWDKRPFTRQVLMPRTARA